MIERAQIGWFTAGNAGGPGRPRWETERLFLDATLAAVSADDWSEIVRRAAAGAKSRDWLARVLGIEAARAAPYDAGESVHTIFVIEEENWYGNKAHELAKGKGNRAGR